MLYDGELKFGVVSCSQSGSGMLAFFIYTWERHRGWDGLIYLYGLPSTWWSKSHIPSSWHMFWVPKKITLESENKRQCDIKCWKCPWCSAIYSFAFFLMFDASRWRVSAVMFGMPSSLFCFCSFNVCGLVFIHAVFQKPPELQIWWQWIYVWGGHKFQEIMWPPKNSLKICFAEFAIAPSCWNQESFLLTSKRSIKFLITSW
jgi:hypothetical protein